MIRFLLPAALLALTLPAAAQQTDAWSYDGQVGVAPTSYSTVPTYPEGVDDTHQAGRWYVDDNGDRVFVAWGQGELPNAGDYRQPFEDLDTDRDGRLRKGDLPAGHALNFEWHLVDRNRDGVITADEFHNWR